VLTKKLPRSRIHLDRNKFPFSRPNLPGYQLEFPGSDRSVVQRTQFYNYEHFNERPVQIQTYFSVPDMLHVAGIILMAIIFAILSMFDTGRRLLESYPSFFTFGAFSKDGPSRAQIDSTSFSLTLIGKGWSKKEGEDSSDPNIEPPGDIDKTVIVEVSGADPGYVATSTCLVQSGLTILKDRANMPKYVEINVSKLFKLFF